LRRRVHKDKARFAKWLHDTGAVSVDVSARLEELNDLRKDVQYGGPALDPSEIDFEDMARELERFLDEVETRVRESPR
jgi:hypothetical protein